MLKDGLADNGMKWLAAVANTSFGLITNVGLCVSGPEILKPDLSSVDWTKVFGYL